MIVLLYDMYDTILIGYVIVLLYDMCDSHTVTQWYKVLGY